MPAKHALNSVKHRLVLVTGMGCQPPNITDIKCRATTAGEARRVIHAGRRHITIAITLSVTTTFARY